MEHEALTPLYKRWIDDLLGGPIPRESKATCDDCAMCLKPGDEAASDDQFFDPAIKCCSIVPVLANFLVGGILSGDTDADSAHGRASVLNRIAQGVSVSPLGLGQSAFFRLVYDNSDAFGRSRTLRCPHYVEETGRCGIWRNRGTTCVVWFCKHVRGAVSRGFWRDSLERLLDAVESDLASWCVLKLNPGIESLGGMFGRASELQSGPLTAAQLDGRSDPTHQRRIWGEWAGREREFFIECARLVEQLSWREALSICSPRAGIYAELTRAAYEALVSERLPSRLKVGSFQLIQMTSSTSRVRTYSPLDPLEMPTVVMETLGYFDGRSPEAILQNIADEKGIKLDSGLLRKLCDFELLVDPSARAHENPSS
jgi:hypothetical protein